jgi:DNA polymerase-3 subunit delta'
MRDESHPDYLTVGVPEGRQNLPIRHIRQIEHQTRLQPSLSDARVFVVRDADTMSLEAANSFLKTLEEPPGDCFFILIAASLRRLPETVLSRCWIVRFSNLPPEDLAGRLREAGAGSDDARWLARQAWGSPGVAEKLREADFHAVNRKLIDEMLGYELEDNFRLADVLNQIADEDVSSATEGRRKLQDLLECIVAYYRDLAVLAADAEDRAELVNAGAAERLGPRSQVGRPEHFVRLAEVVLDAMDRVDGNANRRLTLDAMFTDLARREAR